MRAYRPSNGTEGEFFHEAFCYRCVRYGDPDGNIPPCEIQGIGLSGGYPKEWVEDEKGPRCTAFWPQGKLEVVR